MGNHFSLSHNLNNIMFSKILLLSVLALGAFAKPQNSFDSFDNFNQEVDDTLGPINPNPQYTYSYQVSDDDKQTYLAHNEDRDGDVVTGTYSYVDPNGALITVTYTADKDGYREERNVQDGFVQIRSRPVQRVQPVPTPAPTRRPVQTTPPPPPPRNNDSDLVARIIAQLTPFIRETVSNSLNTPAPAPRPNVPAPAPARPTASGTQDIFGLSGE